MKRQISLKLFVTLAFLSLAVILVIGYSFLSAHYYRLGMGTIMANNMEKAAHDYIERVPSTQRNKANHFKSYIVAHNWHHLPLELQKAFGTPPAEPGFSVKEKGQHWFKPYDVIYFLYMYRNNSETLYVSFQGTKAKIPPVIERMATQSKKMLLAISASIAGVLGIIILILLRHVSKPVSALRQWARSLGPDNLHEQPPDFSYPELNEMAELIRTSLSSVQDSLEREHSFLRYASHELRTPIAIIRNNVELLHKLENQTDRTAQRLQVVDRIDRAGLTMQHLTETLLWLSRNEVASLPCRQFELDALLQKLVRELIYLLNRRNIKLELKTDPYTAFLPEVPTQIVLGNLVRNAFQHSFEGCITIHQQSHRVVISNPQAPASSSQQDLGFGLGLQLTAKLCAKLGWCYQEQSVGQHHTTTLTLNSTGSGSESAPDADRTLPAQ